jgi:hypothetical protein
MNRILLVLISFSLIGCIKEDIQQNPATTVNNGNTSGNSGGGVAWPVSEGMETSYSENWDDWDFSIKEDDTTAINVNVYTSYSENWDGWNFSANGFSGSLTTSYSENWDHWNLSSGSYNIELKTSYSENWDDWDIDDNTNGWHCDVRTSYSENWDDWDADDYNNDMHKDLATSYSENWDDWNTSGSWDSAYPNEYKIAVLFVPVIVNVMRIQGLIP